jgi:hypothetical protein
MDLWKARYARPTSLRTLAVAGADAFLGLSAGVPVHRTFSNLKTWLQGTHHGVRAKHLPHDVNEFVFRLNRRRTPMAAFQSLLGHHPARTNHHKML